jgi:hypothetical protein
MEETGGGGTGKVSRAYTYCILGVTSAVVRCGTIVVKSSNTLRTIVAHWATHEGPAEQTNIVIRRRANLSTRRSITVYVRGCPQGCTDHTPPVMRHPVVSYERSNDVIAPRLVKVPDMVLFRLLTMLSPDWMIYGSY